MNIKPTTFMKAVSSAGTQVRLSTVSLVVRAVIIQAEPSNTGNIFIGGSGVSSADYGILLAAATNEALVLSAEQLGAREGRIDLYDVWIDAAQNGDGVSVLYSEET